MRLPEQRLWDRTRTRLAPYGILMHRIENIVSEGMPDLVTCCLGKTSFVEMKCVEELPKRDSTPLLGKKKGLSAAQKNWHLDWRKAGGCSYVLVGFKDNIALLPGRLADAINDMTLIDVLQEAAAKDWHGVAVELGFAEGTR